MTAARSWLRDHWHPLVIAATAIMVAAIFAGTLIAIITGRDTNRTVDLQQASQQRSECVTAYRGEWQNAVGDIVLVASRGNDPSEEQVLALAQAQRHSLRLNDLCDPTQPGGVVLPEPEETP